jgi:hypothetical protein
MTCHCRVMSAALGLYVRTGKTFFFASVLCGGVLCGGSLEWRGRAKTAAPNRRQ